MRAQLADGATLASTPAVEAGPHNWRGTMRNSSLTMSPQRTLEILELFEKIRRPARISEISRLLGYPASSTSVLMNSMKVLGYLNFDPISRNFLPSVRVALIGGYLRFDGVDGFQVLNLLSSVRDKCGHSIILSSRNGVFAQYIYTLDSPGRTLMTFKAGDLRPLTRTSGGIALLTDYTNDEIGRIVRHLNSLPDVKDQEEVADVLEEVRMAREKGHACLKGRLVREVGSLALKLPFRDNFGKSLALSISGPADSIWPHQDKLASLIKNEIYRHCSVSMELTDI